MEGEPSAYHADQKTSQVVHVMIITVDASGKKIENNSKDNFHLCWSCLGNLTRLTRGGQFKEYQERKWKEDGKAETKDSPIAETGK
jgi:hypothetical protein